MDKKNGLRERIPVTGSWITQKEIDCVTDAVTNAWYSNANIYHECFEKAFADYLGVRFAISLSSCTSVIHLSLLALSVRLRDEVIVPDVTWIALNYEGSEIKNTYWMVTVILDEKIGLEKGTVIKLMAEKGIDCRPFFYPLSSLPAYQNLEESGRAKQRNVVSYAISPYGINLPSGLNMTEEKIIHVCGILKSLFN